jgi:hypothetical protein
MHLSSLTLRNFRQYGDGDASLEITFNSGVTALVGRNDSGKSAVIDAIRYALLTRDQEFIRVQPEDFHLDQTGKQAGDIFIRCKLSGLDADEKGALVEYLSYEGNNVSLFVNWTARRLSESPSARRWVDVSVRSGIDGTGPNHRLFPDTSNIAGGFEQSLLPSGIQRPDAPRLLWTTPAVIGLSPHREAFPGRTYHSNHRTPPPEGNLHVPWRLPNNVWRTVSANSGGA